MLFVFKSLHSNNAMNRRLFMGGVVVMVSVMLHANFQALYQHLCDLITLVSTISAEHNTNLSCLMRKDQPIADQVE